MSVRQPGRSNVAPVLAVRWDTERIGAGEVQRQLSEGEPRIEVFTHAEG